MTAPQMCSTKYSAKYSAMRTALAAFLLIGLLPSAGTADELELIFRHGKPKGGWARHVNFASWIDEDRIVYATSREVTCVSAKSREVQWVIRDAGTISDWSVSRQTKRVAYLSDKKTNSALDGETISIIDGAAGKTLFIATSDQLAKILGLDSTNPTRIALAPNDGRLIVCLYSTFWDRNAYVLDPTYAKLLSSSYTDASPREISPSPDGLRLAVVADDQVLCVRDLAADRDVFFRGNRIGVKSDSFGHAIDLPFFSHLRDSGRDLLVYTLDNFWSTGRVFVHDIKSGEIKSFDARNGEIELDVSFPTRRIALTGTSDDVTILDFDGNVIAHQENATEQRRLCVEFSPSGDRIVVGNWDNTISVFSVPNPRGEAKE